MSETVVERTSTTRLAVAVLVGVLAAAAVIFVVWQTSQPSDFDCAMQRADYQLGKIEVYEIDDACR